MSTIEGGEHGISLSTNGRIFIKSTINSQTIILLESLLTIFYNPKNVNTLLHLNKSNGNLIV